MDIQIHIYDQAKKHICTEAVFMSRSKDESLAAVLRRTATHAHRIAEEDHPTWGAIEIEIKR